MSNDEPTEDHDRITYQSSNPLAGLIALDSRTVSQTKSSALISIPGAKDIGLLEDDQLEATVTVRKLENEIVVEARIPIKSD